MIPERKQMPGRIIRTGWPVAGSIDAAASETTPPHLGSADEQLGEEILPRHQGSVPRRRRIRTRSRLRTTIATITVIGLLSIALPWLLLRHEGPDDVTREYLDAVISGDMETVRRHVRPVDGTLDTAITAAVHQATAGGIASYTIDRVDLRSTSAEVTATLRNRREEHRTVLRLHATSAGPFSPVTWELDPIQLPILTISPLTGTDSLLLNGQLLEIPEVLFSERGANRIGVVLHVLPGSYAIELPPPQPPMTSRPRVIYVPPVLGQWQTGMIDVDYGLSPPAEARVRSVIRSEIAQCAESTSPRPPGCPFAVDLPEGTVGSWSVTQQPEIDYVNMLGDSFQFRGEHLVAEFTVSTPADRSAQPPAPAAPASAPSAHSRESPPSAPAPLSLVVPAVIPASGAAPQQEPMPGSVHVTSALFGASIHRVDGGYELAAWSYAGTRPLPH